MNPTEITKLIETGFDGAIVQVLSDDNTHYEAIVVASEFEGQRPIKRHQLVYKTLGTLVGNEIHALSLKTFTPDEWRQKTGQG